MRPRSTTADSDDDDYDDDNESDGAESEGSAGRGRSRGSSARRSVRNGRKRMSLLTGETFDVPRLEERDNGYYDLGCGHEPWANDLPPRGVRRRFFQGPCHWDDKLHQVVLERQRAGADDGAANIGDVMSNGGREEGQDSSESMDVDSEDI